MPTDPTPEPGARPAPPAYLTYAFDPNNLAPATWYSTYDRDGHLIHSGPTPMPEPPAPGSVEPPDEPHVVG